MGAGEWDARYGGEAFAYGTEPNDWLRERAGCLPPGAGVLSLAEGEGRNAAFLAGLGLRVTAVDQSEVGLAKARRLAGEREVFFETVRADLADYDPGHGRWDGIVSIWCHVPSALRGPLHRRAFEALKPGGRLILEAYGPGQIALGTGGPRDGDMLADLDTLQKEWRGMEWISAAAVRRVVSEGAFHGGLSETVQLEGRKPL